VIRAGSQGAEVAAWQAFLVVQGYAPGAADGVFGAATDAATRAWQDHEGLAADGIVGPASYERARAAGFRFGDGLADRWIPARWFTPAGRGPTDVSLVVIHTTEGPETERRSERTAGWFADERSRSSAHYIVDPAQAVQCVRECDIAWHAGVKIVNARSIGIEHCGTAQQSEAQWADAASVAELERSAMIVAALCARYSIPAIWLTPTQVAAGERGICGHVDVTEGYVIPGGHRDPGKHFPRDKYIALVAALLADDGVIP
jgi:hypothetical protein